MPGFFDVFSKRERAFPEVFSYDELPAPLRVQIIFILEESLFKRWEHALLERIASRLCEEHGIFSLNESHKFAVNTGKHEITECIEKNKNLGLVLDVIEACMRGVGDLVRHDGPITNEVANRAYKKLNHRFQEHGVGYRYAPEARKLIRIDSTLLHNSAVLPVLSLLTDSKFAVANTEFLAAFDDLKKSDYNDCAAKSCTAYESVLKVICAEKGWPFNADKDTCGKLVQIVIQNGNLDDFLTEPLKLIGIIRNKKSSAHGGGMIVRNVSEELAHFCLNATASAILYVVNATK